MSQSLLHWVHLQELEVEVKVEEEVDVEVAAGRSEQQRATVLAGEGNEHARLVHFSALKAEKLHAEESLAALP